MIRLESIIRALKAAVIKRFNINIIIDRDSIVFKIGVIFKVKS
jgi:hypothetical protein